jgi:hypothetical protein
MLILLPLSTFLSLWLTLSGRSLSSPGESSLRLAALETAVLLGAFVALSSEGLSLFHALSTPWVAVLWALFLVMSAGLGWRKSWLQAGWRATIDHLRCLEHRDFLLLSLLAIPVALLFLVALLSPVNNTDSLLYHLTRVAHWIQDRSLLPYPSGYPNQIIQPIWAEEAILQLRLLAGSDRFVNLVQWGCMLGSLGAVSLLAKLLGAGRGGQLAAGAFALSIPMGLLQSTSTQNDYVAAFWLVSLAIWVLLASRRSLSLTEWLFLGLALGLGLLTKGTFYPAVFPFIVWLSIAQARQMQTHRIDSTRGILLLVGVVVLLNLGFWVRNTAAFGDPLALSATSGNLIAIGTSPGEMVTNLAKNLLMNFVTPYSGVNDRLAGMLHSVFGSLDPNLASFHLTWAWNQEDLAGNPFHFLLVPISLLLLLIHRKRLLNRSVWTYAGACLGVFLVLSLALRYQEFSLRFQLSFLIAWAPLFGLAVSRVGERRLVPVVVILLVIAALPWVFFNRSRPLISMRTPPERFGLPCDWHFGCTVGSILIEPPQTIAFANWMDLREPYLATGQAIQASGCRQVGLRIDSHDPEYLLWWVLDAPQSGIRIENVYPLPELARFADPSFHPCAVVCTICKDRKDVGGLPLHSTFEDVTLFMKKEQTIH